MVAFCGGDWRYPLTWQVLKFMTTAFPLMSNTYLYFGFLHKLKELFWSFSTEITNSCECRKLDRF